MLRPQEARKEFAGKRYYRLRTSLLSLPKQGLRMHMEWCGLGAAVSPSVNRMCCRNEASLPRRGPSGGRRPHREHTVRPSAALSVPLSGSQPAALCIPRPSHFLWPTAPETRDGKKTETRCQGLSVSAPRRATQESHGGGTGVEAPGSAGTASRPRETQVCLCGHALGLPHA